MANLSRSAGRVIRSMALLMAGMLVGQAAVSIAATSKLAATASYVRTTSCPGLAFGPLSLHVHTTARDALRGVSVEGPEVRYVICHPDLPTGATVTRVRFTVRDIHDDGHLHNCGLVRNSLLAGDDGAVRVMALVRDTGHEARPGVVRLTDDTIKAATVDNGRYAYYLQCGFQQRSRGLEVRLGIYGADITYRISSRDG